ncbi:MAG: tRNA 2-thiocytidine(32) synthetase TtcA, partial [Kangiellaceae bacterium]|nr:tRNA 2-thiocytidine(32) synthetase TtcA [Kangiellaceae bacterium]
EEDTYSIVKEKVPEGKTTCSLCSRLRRGIIYKWAKNNGITKIALGHHRDDMVETLFLNMFFGGKMKSMPPKLLSDNGEHIVIRPLAYAREKDIARYSNLKGFPIIPCNLCGSQENLQRKQVKQMLNSWDKQYPGRIESIFNAMGNIATTHMTDTSLFEFTELEKNRANWQDSGDTLFDDEPIPVANDAMASDVTDDLNQIGIKQL